MLRFYFIHLNYFHSYHIPDFHRGFVHPISLFFNIYLCSSSWYHGVPLHSTILLQNYNRVLWFILSFPNCVLRTLFTALISLPEPFPQICSMYQMVWNMFSVSYSLALLVACFISIPTLECTPYSHHRSPTYGTFWWSSMIPLQCYVLSDFCGVIPFLRYPCLHFRLFYSLSWNCGCCFSRVPCLTICSHHIQLYSTPVYQNYYFHNGPSLFSSELLFVSLSYANIFIWGSLPYFDVPNRCYIFAGNW